MIAALGCARVDGVAEGSSRIIAQLGSLIVVDKPSGLAVHRGWADDEVTVLDEVRTLVGTRVHLAHRLDRATSGVLLLTTSLTELAALERAFAERLVKKRYLALVRGPGPEQQTIDYPLRRGEERGPNVPRVEAVTEVRRLAVFERYALVEALPRTGRLHQIRRHLKHVSLPIIGDSRYGKGEHNRLFRERFGLFRLALHAAALTLAPPVVAEEVTFRAPPSASLRRVLSELGLLEAAEFATAAKL